jgi:2-C-methyl-D-erythritol 2,4-cyclodiphosphate synthase/2-C-methyl-D-erythritol 4-phosphate cytidylyltransferase
MGGEIKKEYRLLNGRPVLLHSLITFLTVVSPAEIVLTIPAGDQESVRTLLNTHFTDLPYELRPFLKKIKLVVGGNTRQESVRRGLEVFSTDHDIVIIHDGARPWISPELVRQVIETAMLYGACIPVVPSTNAMKRIAPDGTIEAHLPRAVTVGAQTPQAFRLASILEAHRLAAEDGIEYIDDSEIYHRYIGPVYTVPGELTNIKITYPTDLPEDLNRAHTGHTKKGGSPMRIGFGWDLHTLVEGRPLLLGGVRIDAPFGESGHSDGDVLIHAVIDALFGAAKLGDIGTHFPPTDPRWKDSDSTRLLEQAVALVHEAGYQLINLDTTVVLQDPKLAPYITDITARLAEVLLTSPDNVSVKAKTKEHVDAVGEGRAIEAYATVLIGEPYPDIWT